MWAYRLVGPKTFERVHVAPPAVEALAEGDVLLRTLAGGICGSDFSAFRGHRGRLPGDVGTHGADLVGYPMHETVGDVVASRSGNFRPGDRVVGWASGFDGISELVVSREGDLVHCDRSLEPCLAVGLQPLACVIYAAEQLGDLHGRTVAVIGQGPLGVLFSHVAKARRAAWVIGVDPIPRDDVSGFFGVDEPVWATSDRWAASLGDQRPSVVVEAVGHQVRTLGDAIEAVQPGGLVYYFGVGDDDVYPLSMRDVLRKNLTLKAGVTLERRRVLAAARDYAAGHPQLLGRYVTDRFPAERVQEAFELAARPAKGRLKVVLDMTTETSS